MRLNDISEIAQSCNKTERVPPKGNPKSASQAIFKVTLRGTIAFNKLLTSKTSKNCQRRNKSRPLPLQFMSWSFLIFEAEKIERTVWQCAQT